MKDRLFPFGAVPVYNPQSLSKGEALAQFHARQNTYQRLIELLRDERPSHVLIIGTRGMGKTTLLQRVRYGVEDDAELNSRYLVLTFPEEQYNVNRLSHFLLNTLEALADSVERLSNDPVLARIEDCASQAAKLGHEGIEDVVPKLLSEVGQNLEKDFLLLVDNADRLFEMIDEKEQWRLREMLSSRPDLTLFGATAQASEGIYGHDRAFYEFFSIQRLTPLTLAEVRELLLRLSESLDEPAEQKGTAKRRVEQWLATDEARLRTLVQLTGGNPRTTVLLFNLVLDGLGGGAREYLEQLLDQCTPNYKGRVDDLAPQAQQVLDAVALRWDPVMAMEIAADTGLDTPTVSTHLTRLVRQGILERADAGDSRKALYQVAERFFNIWYLMRASRRVRAKLRWFVEFLRVFFDSGELERIAKERVRNFSALPQIRPAEMETAFAYALASGVGRNTFETFLRTECANLELDWRPYLDLIHGTALDEMGVADLMNSETTGTVGEEPALRAALELDRHNVETWVNLAKLLDRNQRYAEAEEVLRRAIENLPGQLPLLLRLGVSLMRKIKLHPEAEDVFRKAIVLDTHSALAWAALGMLLTLKNERQDEAEEALQKAISLDPTTAAYWHALGKLLARMPGRQEAAEAAIRRSIELVPEVAEYWSCLGDILTEDERHQESIQCYQKATDLDPDNSMHWVHLARGLIHIGESRVEAETALRKATELASEDPRVWTAYASWVCALAYGDSKRFAIAEAAARKAVSLDPRRERSLVTLARTIFPQRGRMEEAAVILREAIELDPQSGTTWNLLGDVLRKIPGRIVEAEGAYRRAVDLDPQSASFRADLALFIASIPRRRADAELEIANALHLAPNDHALWATLGLILACHLGKPKEAEAAFRKAVELEPDELSTLRNLGVLLYCQMSKPIEGIEFLRRAANLEPSNSLTAAMLAAASESDAAKYLPVVVDESSKQEFWESLLEPVTNYLFGKILARICHQLHDRQGAEGMARLYRAVAFAQLGDFPRASVALEDALSGDPITLLETGRSALEVIFAAAVKNDRAQECIDVLDNKGWKDAWRPIYEALKAVESGSAEYLKRVAVEIREPAMIILHRIAPELGGRDNRPGDGQGT